jgi:hypothetical protein
MGGRKTPHFLVSNGLTRRNRTSIRHRIHDHRGRV